MPRGSKRPLMKKEESLKCEAMSKDVPSDLSLIGSKRSPMKKEAPLKR
jgi:hypothetical protein